VTVQQRALERALTERDAAAVATSAARLRIALRGVTPSELAPIRAEIDRLLDRADALLDRDRRGNDGLSPPVSQTLTSTPRPTNSADVSAAPTGTAAQAASPAAPLPTTATPAAPSTTLHDGGDGDNSGPGGGGGDADAVADDHSGPGGGDDNSGPGGGGDSGGDSSGSGSSGSSGGSGGSSGPG
jgi:hypothetical protein